MLIRPYATLILLFFTAVITAAPFAFDASIYGVNTTILEWLCFSPQHPFRNLGAPWFLSAFFHLNFEHWLTNLFFLTPIALMMERKQSARFLFISVFWIHIVTLLQLWALAAVITLDDTLFLGCSHIVIGLFTYWGLAQKKYSLLLIPLAILTVEFIQHQSALTLTAHTLGLVTGVEYLAMNRLLTKLRLQRSN